MAEESGAREFLETPAAAVRLSSGTRLGPYKSPRSSGQAAWGRSTRRGTRAWGGLSQSRSCRRTSRPTRNVAAASSMRPAPCPRSTTRTSARCTTSGKGTRGTGAPWIPAGSSRPPRRVSYLVLELLDGQTLAERLRKGALPLAQALESRRTDCGRPERGAPPGHRAPRSQARQHHADQARREAARLRPGEAEGRLWALGSGLWR